MLLQLHHQWPGGRTDFVSEREISTHDEIRDWARQAAMKNPVPKGAKWVLVTEESPFFVRNRIRGRDQG